MLAKRFEHILHDLGMAGLEHPLFYHAPVGIRFKIGGEEPIYLDRRAAKLKTNPAYVQGALDRAAAIYRANEHPVLLVQPAVFHRQAHAVQQDAVQGFCIGGQTLEPWLLKKSLGNAVERKQFSGLSVKVVKGHVAFSTFCSSLCSKNQPPFV